MPPTIHNPQKALFVTGGKFSPPWWLKLRNKIPEEKWNSKKITFDTFEWYTTVTAIYWQPKLAECDKYRLRHYRLLEFPPFYWLQTPFRSTSKQKHAGNVLTNWWSKNWFKMPSNAETGLQPNEERSHTLFVSPIGNASWPVGDKNISYTIPPGK